MWQYLVIIGGGIALAIGSAPLHINRGPRIIGCALVGALIHASIAMALTSDRAKSLLWLPFACPMLLLGYATVVSISLSMFDYWTRHSGSQRSS